MATLMKLYVNESHGKVYADVERFDHETPDKMKLSFYMVTLKQNGDEITIQFERYNSLHLFATTLMSKVSSVRPD